MKEWWIHLTWSQAALVVVLWFFALMVVLIWMLTYKEDPWKYHPRLRKNQKPVNRCIVKNEHHW